MYEQVHRIESTLQVGADQQRVRWQAAGFASSERWTVASHRHLANVVGRNTQQPHRKEHSGRTSLVMYTYLQPNDAAH